MTRHTLFRQETRWSGYYYRAGRPKLDDADWHVFTGSQYDPKTGEWNMSKLPVHHIVQAAYRSVSFNRCTLPDGPFGNCPTSFR